MTERQQVKSRQRVEEHGEVFTNEREVNAMLDMVKQETERIDSRFLEPACGDGNFLAEVLRRKLDVVGKRYGKSQLEYERYAFVAVSSIYGVDIMQDNVEECRERMYSIANNEYSKKFKAHINPDFQEAIRYVLDKNILCGDALTLKDVSGSPITFAEWSMVTGDKVKRCDYRLSDLLDGHTDQLDLFQTDWEYDEETQAYIPTAIREYPLMDYWKVQNNG